MSTVSTAPTLIDALVKAIGAEMTGSLSEVGSFEVWPGTEARREMVFLGDVTWDEYDLATIVSGRKRRQEDYSVAFEVWVLGETGSSPSSPKTARDKAFAILGKIEDVLADDPRVGLAHTVIQWVVSVPAEAGPRKFEKGWAYRVAGSFKAHARLT